MKRKMNASITSHFFSERLRWLSLLSATLSRFPRTFSRRIFFSNSLLSPLDASGNCAKRSLRKFERNILRPSRSSDTSPQEPQADPLPLRPPCNPP